MTLLYKKYSTENSYSQNCLQVLIQLKYSSTYFVLASSPPAVGTHPYRGAPLFTIYLMVQFQCGAQYPSVIAEIGAKGRSKLSIYN